MLSRAMERSTSPCSSVPLMEGESSIAHHARAVAGGVSRAPQIEELGGQTPPPGFDEQTVDRPRPARLTAVERPSEAGDLTCRHAVGLPRLLIRKVVGEVRADDDRRL